MSTSISGAIVEEGIIDYNVVGHVHDNMHVRTFMIKNLVALLVFSYCG